MDVGIDLGTTYSAVAYLDEHGSPVVIKNEFGEETTPSVVAFDENGQYIGREAKEMQAAGLESTMSAFKRNMGDSAYSCEFFGRRYDATDLSAIFLTNLKRIAEEQTGQRIDNAVITVPAYFDDRQKSATLEAGKRAGLNVLRLVHEPTAASVYYGLKNAVSKVIMTYDLGGGTFDITLLKIDNGNISVIGTLGDANLGGKDWDAEVKGMLIEQYMDEFGEDPSDSLIFNTKYAVECERLKKELSVHPKVRVPISIGSNRMTAVLELEDFESRTAGLVDTTIQMCESLLEETGMVWSDLSDIVLVGGSTRLPAVRRRIKEVSGVNVIVNEDTDLAVAKGAALFTADRGGTITVKRGISGKGTGDQGGALRKISVEDAIAHSLGALATDPSGTHYVNEIMIRRNSKIPAKQRKDFRIEPGNRTDRIEVYTMQGESKSPLECTVLAMVSAEGIVNDGKGVTIGIEYSYNVSGMVDVAAFQDGRPLTIVKHPVPDDISWMGKPIEKKSVSRPIGLILSIDLSGSMIGMPLSNAISAAKEFVRKFPDARFCVIGYADRVKTLCEWKDADSTIGYVEQLRSTDCGGCNDAHPFDEILRLYRSAGETDVYEICLTDGIWYCKERAVSSAKRCMGLGIGCIAIGFGSADHSFLRRISSMDEGAIMSSSEHLVDAFSTIATTIGNRYIG